MNHCAKLILFVLIIVTLGATAQAEPTHPNEIGLYAAPDGYGPTGTDVVGTPVSLYLVLTKPTNFENANEPCTTYNGFELRMEFDPLPAGNLLLLDSILPGEHVDIGIKDMEGGIVDYIVGVSYGQPLPVVDETMVVAELVFLNLGVAPTMVYLVPVDGGISIPGNMAFLGGHAPSIENDLLPMYPVSGSFDSPVFIFNGAAVAVEEATFGSLKALYR